MTVRRDGSPWRRAGYRCAAAASTALCLALVACGNGPSHGGGPDEVPGVDPPGIPAPSASDTLEIPGVTPTGSPLPSTPVGSPPGNGTEIPGVSSEPTLTPDPSAPSESP
jgi:hypothetical protein